MKVQEFVTKIIEDFFITWNLLRIFRKKPRHSQLQGPEKKKYKTLKTFYPLNLKPKIH